MKTKTVFDPIRRSKSLLEAARDVLRSIEVSATMPRVSKRALTRYANELRAAIAAEQAQPSRDELIAALPVKLNVLGCQISRFHQSLLLGGPPTGFRSEVAANVSGFYEEVRDLEFEVRALLARCADATTTPVKG